MEIRFLGKETDHGDSPTLYATDQGSYLVQGWKVSDPDVLAKLDVPMGDTVVEIYARLMTHLAKDGLSGVVMSWVPPIVHVKATSATSGRVQAATSKPEKRSSGYLAD